MAVSEETINDGFDMSLQKEKESIIQAFSCKYVSLVEIQKQTFNAYFGQLRSQDSSWPFPGRQTINS